MNPCIEFTVTKEQQDGFMSSQGHQDHRENYSSEENNPTFIG